MCYNKCDTGNGKEVVPMGRCGNCGYEVEEEVGICPNCGKTHRKKKEEPIFKDEMEERPSDVGDPGSIVGLVMGLVGLIAWVIPLAGLSFAIVGVVLSNRGRKLQGNRHRMFALVGFFLNLFFVIFNIFMFTLLCMGEAPA